MTSACPADCACVTAADLFSSFVQARVSSIITRVCGGNLTQKEENLSREQEQELSWSEVTPPSTRQREG